MKLLQFGCVGERSLIAGLLIVAFLKLEINDIIRQESVLIEAIRMIREKEVESLIESLEEIHPAWNVLRGIYPAGKKTRQSFQIIAFQSLNRAIRMEMW